MPTSDRDTFYECFWATPELPTPQMKGGVLAAPLATDDAALTPAMADLRLTLKNRLKLIELTREDEVVKALEICRQYCHLLQSGEFHPTSMVSCRWKSCFAADPTDMPLLFELPMVLVTRAMLLLNHAKCVSRCRDRDRIAFAAELCLEAAGIFDYVIERMNTHLIDGIEPPSAILDLSLDMLQSMQSLCLAIAQQLSIVQAAFHVDKTYSKPVLVKLHSGCQASLQAFETTLQRTCSAESRRSTPSRCDAKMLVAFVSFFSRLHRAQAFLLTAEVEYEAHNVSRAVAFLGAARTLFQDRASSSSAIGLSSPPSHSERLVRKLAAKRAALDERFASWTREHAASDWDDDATLTDEDSVLDVALPQAFVMKPQPFDSRRDSTSRSDAVVAAAERIQVIDEHSDEEHDADSASEGEVFLERIDMDDRRPSVMDRPVKTAALPLPTTRQSLLTALSDVMQTTSQAAASAAPTRRQSERAPSATTAQIAAIAERAARRKKSAGVEFKSEASKANAEIVGAQERFKAVALQERLQPPRSERGADGGDRAAAAIHVVQSAGDERMCAQLAQGKSIFRLAKDTRWRKETMFLVGDELQFVRKKPLLFSTMKKATWSAVQAVQLEPGEVAGTHFILIVARKGEEMTTFEITATLPSDNRALFQYLHRLHQEKRKKSVVTSSSRHESSESSM